MGKKIYVTKCGLKIILDEDISENSIRIIIGSDGAMYYKQCEKCAYPSSEIVVDLSDELNNTGTNIGYYLGTKTCIATSS